MAGAAGMHRSWAACAAALVAVSALAAAPAALAHFEHADNIRPVVTFKFIDGTEVLPYPVFIMGENHILSEGAADDQSYVVFRGAPSFILQGPVYDAPLLHRMLDTAFEYRFSPAHRWDYRFADVDISFVSPDKGVLRTLAYHDCYVVAHEIDTQTDDYESYLATKTGFAMTEEIEFFCGGLKISAPAERPYDPENPEVHTTGSKYFRDIKTFIDFEFDEGIERVEFPVFELTAGFAEDPDLRRIVPAFRVESLISSYPLLHGAIDEARKNENHPPYANTDFEARVTFEQNGTVLRGLDFFNCRPLTYLLETLHDREEGFTGKSLFAHVEKTGFECTGLTPTNPRYEQAYGPGKPPKERINMTVDNSGYKLALGIGARVTFEYDDGTETAFFPVFKQGRNVLSTHDLDAEDLRTYSFPPSFTLASEISDLPMLYERIDENYAVQFTTGTTNFVQLFGVDVMIMNMSTDPPRQVRGFNYSDCRVVDYAVQTIRDKEASYKKGFVMQNEFDFECIGYSPYNPAYERMIAYDEPESYSSADYQRDQRRNGVGYQ